jgi:hypothetical protein
VWYTTTRNSAIARSRSKYRLRRVSIDGTGPTLTAKAFVATQPLPVVTAGSIQHRIGVR